MNTTAKALVFAIAAVAGAAAIGTGLAYAAAPAQPQIVKLERVVVIGKRAATPAVVAQLPRVVITGRSSAQADLQLAAAKLPVKTI